MLLTQPQTRYDSSSVSILKEERFKIKNYPLLLALLAQGALNFLHVSSISWLCKSPLMLVSIARARSHDGCQVCCFLSTPNNMRIKKKGNWHVSRAGRSSLSTDDRVQGFKVSRRKGSKERHIMKYLPKQNSP
ncbi:hypothetical protein PoB_002363700 [Plakobranchus ocellatus]|uniref:Uncharacterized protein n=1 Tax=Plakobranchus ocellatus TaxID=259542 RepID=A0AAV3ZRJ0_9GAST|nr:hypothetical protein PoB_002363700 [Plakobranchus ocellatus]